MTRKLALAVLAACIVSPALADRLVTGEEAQSIFAGKSFSLSCVNGVNGRGSFNGSVVRASYRMPSAAEGSDPVQDLGKVRSRGSDLCIAWRHLTNGDEGCYRVSERSPGRYRIAVPSGHLWCDFAVH